MRQPVYTIFISINQASFHLRWKENLVKHQDIPKYYENDWKLTGFTSKDIMMIFVDLADSWSNFRLIEIVNAKNKIILGRRHSSPLKKILHFYQPPPPYWFGIINSPQKAIHYVQFSEPINSNVLNYKCLLCRMVVIFSVRSKWSHLTNHTFLNNMDLIEWHRSL